jgi:hypothetical protein
LAVGIGITKLSSLALKSALVADELAVVVLGDPASVSGSMFHPVESRRHRPPLGPAGLCRLVATCGSSVDRVFEDEACGSTWSLPNSERASAGDIGVLGVRFVTTLGLIRPVLEFAARAVR